MSWTSKLKNLWAHVRLLLMQFAIVVVLLECVGFFVSDNSYYWMNRYQYYSTDPVRDVNIGLWTYKPNSNIRSAAGYGFKGGKAWLEYDCNYKTNHLGLIDTNYNQHYSTDWLVLGDSFTEGQGGCPYLTRESLAGAKIESIVINGGLMGGGIQSFENLERWVADQVKVNDLLVVAISNDITRMPPKTLKWVSEKDCLENMSCTSKNSIWGIESNATEKELVRKTQLRAKDSSYANTLAYYSFSFRAAQKIFRYTKSLFSSHPSQDKDAIKLNLDALSRLHEKYPKMRLLLIPQKDELGFFGWENSDTKKLKSFMESNSINYTICNLGLDDYLPTDGHPNASGYKKVFSCIAEIINKN